MTAPATIPVTVTPEAAARIAELGFQPHVDRMIEHAREHIPEARRIEVWLNERYDEDSPPGVAVDVWCARDFDPDDRTDWDLGYWVVNTFPPEVLEHLC